MTRRGQYLCFLAPWALREGGWRRMAAASTALDFMREEGFAIAAVQTSNHRSALIPERMLALAVLEDAVSCIFKNCTSTNRKKFREFKESWDWTIEVTSSEEWPFSFESICELFDLSPSAVRKQLERLVQTQQQECQEHAGGHCAPLIGKPRMLKREYVTKGGIR